MTYLGTADAELVNALRLGRRVPAMEGCAAAKVRRPKLQGERALKPACRDADGQGAAMVYRRLADQHKHELQVLFAAEAPTV